VRQKWREKTKELIEITTHKNNRDSIVTTSNDSGFGVPQPDKT